MNRILHFHKHLTIAAAFILIASMVRAQPGCDSDTILPVAVCDAEFTVLVHPVNGAVLYPKDIDDGSFDNCSTLEDMDFRIEFQADFTGTPPGTTSITIPPVPGEYAVVMWVGDESGNWNYCWNTIQVGDKLPSVVSGQVFIDADQNCTLDAGEESGGPEGWTVRVRNLNSGSVRETVSGANGFYTVLIPDAEVGTAADFEVSLLLPSGISSGCSTTYTVSNQPDGLNEVNFAAKLRDCSFLTVDLSTPRIRRCFPNTYYVNYCNYSSFKTAEAQILLHFDQGLSVTGASAAYQDQGGGNYIFPLSPIPAGQCGSFTVTVLAACDLQLGESVCASAEITPFDCEVPGSGWSGASLQVTGDCDETGGTVRFRVTNIGTGDLDAPSPYLVVEDVVMFMQGSLDELAAGAHQDFEYPANGATWHFLLNQAQGHPGQSAPIAFVEGCGGLTAGIVNQFSMDDADPNISIDCQEVIGSYDPNDKQAFPSGRGEDHLISAGEDIEYMIRFQNTGTDTAFNVVIEDQLSEWLDPSTFRAGAGSHPFRTELSEGGKIRFYFENIMLPDSNINEPASHGFVKFKVAQHPGNPDGTHISNMADIFFDFNEPITTNTVWHTVGEDLFQVTSLAPVEEAPFNLRIAPNPVTDSATLSWDGHDAGSGVFFLYDQQGRTVYAASFTGNTILFQRRHLNAGVYFYRILDGDKVLDNGKLVIKR
ncbi:MAG: DUF11 domain-containing protein [Lewinella sp.]|nr:DUF11 domain-containing protein [Lewinella sp.]